jgi:type III pantothenate kinase
MDTTKLGRPEDLSTLLRPLLPEGSLEGATIASVVPSKDRLIHQALNEGLGLATTWVRPGEGASFPLDYGDKEGGGLGADRLANAEGARALFGDQAVVVDLGTAVTVDVIFEGRFNGGIIFPGRGAAARAMADEAEALPEEVEVTGGEAVPLVGKNTGQAMASGLYHGYRALITGLIHQLLTVYGPLPVVATGGNAALLTGLEGVAIDKDLTLKGLEILSRRYG